MEDSFIAHPTELYLRWLQGGLYKGPPGVAFQFGRRAMALELITVYRTLEALDDGDVMHLGIPEALSLIQTLLIDQGLWDSANELYDELCEWRRVRLEPVDEPARVGLASDASAPAKSPPPAGDTRALPPLGQTRGLPSASLGEPESAAGGGAVYEGYRRERPHPD